MKDLKELQRMIRCLQAAGFVYVRDLAGKRVQKVAA
jgi:hypothetical protein